MTDVAAFELAIGHPFRDKRHAVDALTHSSLANELQDKGRNPNNRSEYIGDAVLELAIRDALAARFPGASPGRLDKTKQLVVRNDKIADVTRNLRLAQLLERGGSRPPDTDAVLAQLFEAAVGAVFLDAGFDAARRLVELHVPLPNTLA